MPSPRHDTINGLFRDHPAFAVELLRERMGREIPASGPVRVESNDFNDRPSKDFQPDTVITVGPPNAPAHIREALEEIVSSTWPVYSPFAREHFGRGKAEGLAEGVKRAILRVLAARVRRTVAVTAPPGTPSPAAT